MTLDLTKLALADLGVEDPELALQKVQLMVMRDGRAAFVAGMMLRDCPPYRNEDYAASWRLGWWDACEKEQARKRG